MMSIREKIFKKNFSQACLRVHNWCLEQKDCNRAFLVLSCCSGEVCTKNDFIRSRSPIKKQSEYQFDYGDYSEN